MAEINLEKIEVNSFKGIDRSRPVLLDLGKNYEKGKNITIFKGDQGTGKSSTMEAIMYLLAYNYEKSPAWSKENIKNLTDDTINAMAELEVDGVPHRIKVTKDKFIFEIFLEQLKKWQPLDNPKTTLQSLLGPLGMSPMFLKDRRGKDQIKWFRETFSGDPDAEAKEEKLNKQLKIAMDARRDANRDYTNLDKALLGNDLYQDHEANEKRFATPVTIDAVQERFNNAQEKLNEYKRYENGLVELNNRIVYADKEIEDLEKRLAQVRQNKETFLAKKKEGQEYIAENADCVLEYNDAQKELAAISKTLSDQQAWETIKRQVAERDEFETIVQKYDQKIDKLRDDLQKLTKKYLPDIDGLEMKLVDGEEGIYFNGKSMAQLSESELWGLYLQICKIKGIRFVFIENLSSLGSDAAEVINQLSDEGVKIFASLMDRKQKVFKFSITDKI